MTYGYFIRHHNLGDCMESYTIYVKEHDSNSKYMNEKMLEQYIKKTYGLRFINSAWI